MTGRRVGRPLLAFCRRGRAGSLRDLFIWLGCSHY